MLAATPPLEMKRMFFCMAMVDGAILGGKGRGPVKLMLIVKRANLSGKAQEDEHEHASLPEEAGGGVVRLPRWLPGVKQAASFFLEEYASKLTQNGSTRGLAAPTTFVNKEKGVRLAVWVTTLRSWGGARTSRKRRSARSSGT